MNLIDLFETQRADRPRSVGGILWDVASNTDDDDGTDVWRLELPGFLMWVPVGAMALWLVAYIAGIFPYIGHYEHSSPDEFAPYLPTGPSEMLLVKGQEAFIDYTVESEDGYKGEVAIDIRPVPAHRPTADMKRVSGIETGTLKVTIPATGIYRFHHAAEANSHRKGLSYSVTWGAK